MAVDERRVLRSAVRWRLLFSGSGGLSPVTGFLGLWGQGAVILIIRISLRKSPLRCFCAPKKKSPGMFWACA